MIEDFIQQDLLSDDVEGSVGWLGGVFGVKITRDGDVMVGGGTNLVDSVVNPGTLVNLAKSGRVLPSASIMANKIIAPGQLSRDDRLSIEAGPSAFVSGGAKYGGQVQVTLSGQHIIAGGGLMTPGAGAVTTYKHLFSVPIKW